MVIAPDCLRCPCSNVTKSIFDYTIALAGRLPATKRPDPHRHSQTPNSATLGKWDGLPPPSTASDVPN